MKYYIGIDGGGTKTAVCAAAQDASLLKYAKTDGSSWREKGADNVASIYKDIVLDLIGSDQSHIAGMALGLPCFGESEEGDKSLKSALSAVFPNINIYYANDVEVGWAGSMTLNPGINIVAGTGAIAFGKDIHGKTARCGGWSEFFGDEGSCYWVGRRVMELFSKQSDGRMPKDPLYEIVRKEFNLKNDFGFIDIVHNEYAAFRKQVASLQFLAEKAAMQGSASAKELYDNAVNELLLLVNGICKQLDFSKKPWTVSYTGGLFKAKELVLDQFTHKIESEGGKVSPPCFGPVEGAVLLAFQNFYPEGLIHIQKLMKENQNDTL